MKNKDIQKMKNQEWWILLFAFRYALGRESFAPTIIVDQLSIDWKRMRLSWKRQIREEINYAREHNLCGGECDRKTWEKVLTWDVE